LLLRPEGFIVDTAKSPAAVRDSLAIEFYDAVLIDLNYTRDTTSGREGLDLLSGIVAFDSSIPVIVMTAWGNVQLAVEAIRRGARLHPEAVGERASACHPAHPGRVAPGVAAHAAAGGRSQTAARRRASRFHRGCSVHATGPADHRAHWAIGRQRAGHRRARHGQGNRGPDPARALGAGRHAAGRGKYRR